MGFDVPGIQSRLTEDELVDLIILSGYQLQLRNRTIDFRSLPLTKFVFSVADDLGLDEVTRCWYMLGNFTVHRHASERFMLHLIGRQTWAGEPTANELIALSTSNRAASLFAEITKVAKRYLSYFDGDTVDLRRIIYRHRAPEQFRALYLANLEFTVAFDEVRRVDQGPLGHVVEKRFSERTFELQKALYATELAGEYRQAMSEFTALMEAMIISRASRIERSPEWYAIWKKEFDALAREYNDRVWKYPASQFADETLIGPRADEFRRVVRAHTSTIGRFLQEELPEIELRLSSKGLLPSIGEIENSAGIDKLNDDDRDAIKEAFYLYMK